MPETNRYAFAGKTVIVTGAGSGIGRAIARAFLANDANVVVSGRRVDALHETVSGFPDDRTLVVPADVAVRGDVDALVAAAVERFGALDVMVANAGVYVGGEFADLTVDEWTLLKGTNIDGVVHSVQAALPHLLASGGNVVAVSSVSGLRGDWGQAAYNATKGAINAMLQSLALDLGGRGVRANAVAPAFTLTEMTNHMATTPEALAPFTNRVALGRPGTPDDIAPAVLFLASADAAYITGVILPVDGGTTASTGQPHIG
ncbi:3-oxoacyl-ACP reductase [Subtercola sp. Z020]|uniref:SDR family NAD(P)-dependent oxidoreductase n=1 Tax=Subtercola sp. Z020 TaxID=2080582 RepID=UPI000CE72C0E|nr:SDR family NAD(P)-dependent oxidoreductase [Subtercola sp. Z020]PPF76595.1 3-oxoacyl-ACP reductase [Subtercola sp. Z020]